MFLDLVCTISALLFKLGAAPYHMWIADVYEGSPTIVSLTFAVPRIAVFIVVLRLSFSSFRFFFPKRLLAFSSVGHVGFLFIGLASGSIEGVQGVLYYLFIYIYIRRYFQHAHFIPIVGVGKRGEY